jgi:hypothetical protein
MQAESNHGWTRMDTDAEFGAFYRTFVSFASYARNRSGKYLAKETKVAKRESGWHSRRIPTLRRAWRRGATQGPALRRTATRICSCLFT